MSQENLNFSHVFLFPNASNAKILDMEVLGFFSVYSFTPKLIDPVQPSFIAAPFRKVCIIRGIGYRAQLFENTFSSSFSGSCISYVTDQFSDSFNFVPSSYSREANLNDLNKFEFPYLRYISLRVGHSYHLYIPIPNYIGVKVHKKDRKLVVYGFFKSQVSNFTKYLYSFRPPSVYTGRGIRYKKSTPRRKLGKKDIRKGRFF